MRDNNPLLFLPLFLHYQHKLKRLWLAICILVSNPKCFDKEIRGGKHIGLSNTRPGSSGFAESIGERHYLPTHAQNSLNGNHGFIQEWMGVPIKQVWGTTRCVKSDKGGQNCKICLNLLFFFILSCHLTKPETFGTICHHLEPYGTIHFHSLPFITICQYLLPFGTIIYQSVPFWLAGYHFGWKDTIWHHWVSLSTIGYHSNC